MREIYKKYKKEVWIGVASSLITAGVLKFGNWMLEVMPLIGVSIFDTLSNVIYTMAATYNGDIISRLLLWGFIGFVTGSSIVVIKKCIKFYKDTIKIDKKATNQSNTKKVKIEEVMSESVLEENKENTPDLVRSGKRYGKLAVGLSLCLVLLYLMMIFFISTPMNLHNKFDRDIVKIAPYVDEEEIVQLKSDWVCMRSKLDYENIYEIVNNISEEHNLPK